MDEERCEGDFTRMVFLSRSLVTKAKNTIVKERIWIRRVVSEIVFLTLHPIRALCFTLSTSPSSSASKMSLMKCGLSGNFLFLWLRRVSRKYSQWRANCEHGSACDWAVFPFECRRGRCPRSVVDGFVVGVRLHGARADLFGV